jgi:sugar lactone lactonase YvrE
MNKKIIISLIIFCALIISISTVTTLDNRSQATSNKITYFISQVLGQPNTKETMTNEITQNLGFHLGGVHVDTNDRIYVFDSGNNRILGFSKYSLDQPADIVIGQTNFNSGTSNGDNTMYNNPTAATLSLIPYPIVNSTLESPRQGQMATDKNNNLYVVDLNNNRVLKYNDPFTTDQIADEVWGQPDFVSRTSHCGADNQTPSNSTFCTEYPTIVNHLSTQVFMAGVEIDPSGNMWVTDTGNNRVLRFPQIKGRISKNADIVIGQSNFTKYSPRDGFDLSLSKLNKPISIKFDKSNGDLYILDGEFPGQARLLKFSKPFSSGMSANKEIGRAKFQNKPPANKNDWELINNKWINQASGLNWPRGFIIDPIAGGFWINDGGNSRIIYFSSKGNIGQAIGQPNSKNISCFGLENQGYLDINNNRFNICNPGGEIGLSKNNDMYIATNDNVDPQSIIKFSLPITRGNNNLAVSNGRLLNYGWNFYSGRTFFNPYGMAVSKTNNNQIDQLFVSDRQRLLVWDKPTSKGNFANANYVVGQDNFNSNLNNNGGIFNGIGLGSLVTGGGYLWVSANDRIIVFKLPITSSGKDYPVLKTIFTNDNLFWSDDATPVSFNTSGLAYDSTTDSLWVSDNQNYRVLRIKNPLETATVDLVIGQANKNSISSNASMGNINAKGFLIPWSLQFDNLGNLYVVDSSWEGNGNGRVLRFDAKYTTPINENIFPFPDASGVYAKRNFTSTENWGENTPQTPSYVTFDSKNQMYLLVDGYDNNQNERLFVYSENHTNNVAPQHEKILPIAFGQAAQAIFYQDDLHLLIQDHTWNRILFVNMIGTSEIPNNPI